jgi:hypothetical protein
MLYAVEAAAGKLSDAGQTLMIWRPSRGRIVVDCVNLSEHAPVVGVSVTPTGVEYRVVGHPFDGPVNPIRALQTCLQIPIIEAALSSPTPFPEFDSLTAQSAKPLPSGESCRGWIYHLASDRTLRVYKYLDDSAPLEVRRGKLTL